MGLQGPDRPAYCQAVTKNFIANRTHRPVSMLFEEMVQLTIWTGFQAGLFSFPSTVIIISPEFGLFNLVLNISRIECVFQFYVM